MSKEPAKRSLRSEMLLKAKSLLNKCTPSKDSVKDALCLVLGIAALLTVAARTPQMHDLYLRHKVGDKVYKVQAELRGGGGTGFQVRAPSGVDYVMTNSHVCNAVNQYDAPENKGTALLVDDDGNSIRRRIVAISDETDLCLIEGAPGVSGLSLGNEPGKGETMTVVGHPHLIPITLSSGDVLGKTDVKVIDHVAAIIDNPFLAMQVQVNPKCDLPKNEIIEIAIPEEIGGGKAQLCADVTYGAYMTSIVIYPGNSGSPMVDYWGRVVGVAFASNQSDNFGQVVSLSDIKDFLAHY